MQIEPRDLCAIFSTTTYDMTSSHPVVLITGASRGLGLSVAQLLIKGTENLEKANVVALSRSKTSEIDELATSSSSVELVAVQGDATSTPDAQKAVDLAIERFGRLDAVVLNAGVIEFARLTDVSPESFAHQLNVNVTALITVLHAAAPHLRASPTGVGKAVFVSSGAAVGQTAGWGAYNAGKAALNAVARTLANEEDKIAVWSVRPGVVDTLMQRQIRSEARGAMKEQELQRFEQMHKDGKLLKPEQPAHVLAALAVRGTLQHPRQPGSDSDEGAGTVGSFINWDAAELKDFQLP
jgi:NAD(P)-dependent dehydrogenase (short-subunit alcohol dehydrogenase family)